MQCLQLSIAGLQDPLAKLAEVMRDFYRIHGEGQASGQQRRMSPFRACPKGMRVTQVMQQDMLWIAGKHGFERR